MTDTQQVGEAQPSTTNYAPALAVRWASVKLISIPRHLSPPTAAFRYAGFDAIPGWAGVNGSSTLSRGQAMYLWSGVSSHRVDLNPLVSTYSPEADGVNGGQEVGGGQLSY
jgi:hypothetical protein